MWQHGGSTHPQLRLQQRLRCSAPCEVSPLHRGPFWLAVVSWTYPEFIEHSSWCIILDSFANSRTIPTPNPQHPDQHPNGHQTWLALHGLDGSVYSYFEQLITLSIRRSYSTGQNHYLSFCSIYTIPYKWSYFLCIHSSSRFISPDCLVLPVKSKASADCDGATRLSH